LLKYFNFLVKILIKYEILCYQWHQKELNNNKNSQIRKKWFETFSSINQVSSSTINLKTSSTQILNLYTIYDNIIYNSQKLLHIQLNSKIFLVTKQSKDWMNKMVYFSFLKQNVKQIVPNITSIQQLIGLNNLRPTIYFSISLKEQLKYIFGKNKLLYKSDRHKYLKN
jgi:hypothetical protein